MLRPMRGDRVSGDYRSCNNAWRARTNDARDDVGRCDGHAVVLRAKTVEVAMGASMLRSTHCGAAISSRRQYNEARWCYDDGH